MNNAINVKLSVVLTKIKNNPYLLILQKASWGLIDKTVNSQRSFPTPKWLVQQQQQQKKKNNEQKPALSWFEFFP